LKKNFDVENLEMFTLMEKYLDLEWRGSKIIVPPKPPIGKRLHWFYIASVRDVAYPFTMELARALSLEKHLKFEKRFPRNAIDQFHAYMGVFSAFFFAIFLLKSCYRMLCKKSKKVEQSGRPV